MNILLFVYGILTQTIEKNHRWLFVLQSKGPNFWIILITFTIDDKSVQFLHETYALHNTASKAELLFFQYEGGLTLRIFLRSKWLLDLPDLGIFLGILDFFNGKNNILPKCLFLLKK